MTTSLPPKEAIKNLFVLTIEKPLEKRLMLTVISGGEVFDEIRIF